MAAAERSLVLIAVKDAAAMVGVKGGGAQAPAEYPQAERCCRQHSESGPAKEISMPRQWPASTAEPNVLAGTLRGSKCAPERLPVGEWMIAIVGQAHRGAVRAR